MKKLFNGLLVILMMLALVVPTMTLAASEDGEKKEETTEEKEEEKTEASTEPVNVYIFRGEGCPHCEEALEWFNSEEVQEQYGKYFKLVKYQTWQVQGDAEATADAQTNAQLMSAVGSYFEEDASGVPYIIIGKHTYSGFLASESQTLIDYIMEEYNKPLSERTNVVPDVEKSSGITGIPDPEPVEKDTTVTNVIITVAFLVVVLGIVFAVVKARKED